MSHAEAAVHQRVFEIALDCEDLNDREDLRDDIVLQTAGDSERRLASPSTVRHLEQEAIPAWV